MTALFVQGLIDEVIRREGGQKLTDHVDDSGGKTRFGITAATAARHGYDVETLTEAQARSIYLAEYWTQPNFHKVAEISEKIAFELLDTGVLMGPATPARYLQRLLNVFNQRGAAYPDIKVDGAIGLGTLDALRGYRSLRSNEKWEDVMVGALNGLQLARLVEIAETREKDESFVYGQIRHRCL